MPRDSDDTKLRPDVNEIVYKIAKAALAETDRSQPPARAASRVAAAAPRS